MKSYVSKKISIMLPAVILSAAIPAINCSVYARTPEDGKAYIADFTDENAFSKISVNESSPADTAVQDTVEVYGDGESALAWTVGGEFWYQLADDTSNWYDYDTVTIIAKASANRTVNILLHPTSGFSGYFQCKPTITTEWGEYSFNMNTEKAANGTMKEIMQNNGVTKFDHITFNGTGWGLGESPTDVKIYIDSIYLSKNNIPDINKEYVSGDFKYKYIDDDGDGIIDDENQIQVTGFAEGVSVTAQRDLVIPAELDGLRVVRIGVDAFSGNKNIQRLTIPGTISTVMNRAFQNCTSLRKLTVEDGVQRINSWAFNNADIRKLELPSTLQTLENDAFRDCNELNSVDMSKLSDARFFGIRCFYGCDNLRFIYFPTVDMSADAENNITRVWNAQYMVGGFENFETITAYGSEDSFIKGYEDRIDEGNPSWTSENLTTSGKQLYHFVMVSEENPMPEDPFTYSTIGNEIKITGLGYNSNPTEVVIPDTIAGKPVTEIGVGAFENNMDITSMTMGKNVKIISSNSIQNCKSLRTLTLNDGLEAIRPWSCNWTVIGNLIIPGSVKEIGNNAFDGCSKLETVYMADADITTLGNRAFASCGSLKSIYFPKNTPAAEDYTNSTLVAGCNLPVTAYAAPASYIKDNTSASDGTVLYNFVPMASFSKVLTTESLTNDSEAKEYIYNGLLLNTTNEDMACSLVLTKNNTDGIIEKVEMYNLTIPAYSSININDNSYKIDCAAASDGGTLKAFLWNMGKSENLKPLYSLAFDTAE